MNSDPTDPIVAGPEPALFAFFGFVAFIGFGGAVALGLALLLFPDPNYATSETIGLVIGLFLAVVCAPTAWSMRVSRALLSRDRLELRSALQTRTIPRIDIVGTRNPVGKDDRLRLALRTGTPVKLSGYITRNPAFAAWLETLPNLDDEELQRSQEALENDPALGATPDDRRAALARMTRIARIGTFAAWLVMFWVIFWPEPYAWAVGAALALPVLGVAINAWSGAVFSLHVERNDARPSLINIYFTPIVGLALRSGRDLHFFDWPALLTDVALCAAVLAAIVVFLDRRILSQPPAWFYVALLTFAYGFGAITQLDTLLDRSAPVSYRTTVLDKHSSGGRSPSFYLNLGAWGPHRESGDLSVESDFYRQVEMGTSVCVYVRPGRFGLRWYVVGFC